MDNKKLVKLYIDKIKALKGVKKDKDVAPELGISSTNFSNRKRRGTLIDVILDFAISERLDLNDFFYLEDKKQKEINVNPPPLLLPGPVDPEPVPDDLDVDILTDVLRSLRKRNIFTGQIPDPAVEAEVIAELYKARLSLKDAEDDAIGRIDFCDIKRDDD